MKTIFICAPNRHKERTKALATTLEKLGFTVTFAAEHTKQNMEKQEIFNSNMKHIRNAEIFLAYFVDDGHYGIDFAAEVGKVSEMRKPVIGFVDVNGGKLDDLKSRLDKDLMFTNSFDTFAWSFEELMEVLERLNVPK